MSRSALVGLVAVIVLGATPGHAADSVISAEEALALGEDPAQAPAEEAEIAAIEISDRDAQFLSQAATIGLMEVQGATLALDRATDPDVMEYARRMLDEQHAAEKLAVLAKAKGATPAAEMGESQRKALDALKDKQGVDFDKAYAKAMIEGHEDAIRAFRKAARKCDDNEVRTFASETLETLEARLEMARELEKTVEANAKAPQKKKPAEADDPGP